MNTNPNKPNNPNKRKYEAEEKEEENTGDHRLPPMARLFLKAGESGDREEGKKIFFKGVKTQIRKNMQDDSENASLVEEFNKHLNLNALPSNPNTTINDNNAAVSKETNTGNLSRSNSMSSIGSTDSMRDEQVATDGTTSGWGVGV